VQRPYVIDEMISAKSIAARIESLSREIRDEFSGTNKLVVVGLLRGSFVFIADLVRELDLPVEVDFLEASSYGDGMESSREVRILKDLRGAIEDRDVLVVEDIVDTGFTLHHVTGLLASRNPARMKTIALLEFKMNLWSATALTMLSGTATLPISERCVLLGKPKYKAASAQRYYHRFKKHNQEMLRRLWRSCVQLISTAQMADQSHSPLRTYGQRTVPATYQRASHRPQRACGRIGRPKALWR